jgi:hypothetical protein
MAGERCCMIIGMSERDEKRWRRRARAFFEGYLIGAVAALVGYGVFHLVGVPW